MCLINNTLRWSRRCKRSFTGFLRMYVTNISFHSFKDWSTDKPLVFPFYCCFLCLFHAFGLEEHNFTASQINVTHSNNTQFALQLPCAEFFWFSINAFELCLHFKWFSKSWWIKDASPTHPAPLLYSHHRLEKMLKLENFISMKYFRLSACLGLSLAWKALKYALHAQDLNTI